MADTPQDDTIKLTINGTTYEVPGMDDLQIDEVGTIEDLTGQPFGRIDWESARGVQGMVWLVMHRHNPRFTPEDAGRVKFSQLQSEDEDEKPPAKRPPTKRAAAAKSGAN